MFFCYSVLKKTKQNLLLTQRNAYVDELKSGWLLLLATRY
mgnify:CR=1 FL=1